jgi:hypothetical protein
MSHATTSMPIMIDPREEVPMQPALALWLAGGMESLLHRLQLISRRENSKYDFLAVLEISLQCDCPMARQKNIDYAVCQALNAPNMKGILRALLIYDIMCRWWKNFMSRVNHSDFLEVSSSLEIFRGIGDLHVKGHVKGCLTSYGLTYIEGAGIIDGEILETLWSVLNESSRSTRGATLAHRGEILDDHMNHSNWKKIIGIGMEVAPHPKGQMINSFSAATLVRKWKRALDLFSDAEEAFESLTSTADKNLLQLWEKKADDAQSKRSQNVKAMDYFAIKEYPGVCFWDISITFH